MKKILLLSFILFTSFIFFWSMKDKELNMMNESISIFKENTESVAYKMCSPYFLKKPLSRTDSSFKYMFLYAPFNPDLPDTEMYNMPNKCIELFYNVALLTSSLPLRLGSHFKHIAEDFYGLIMEHMQLIDESFLFMKENRVLKDPDLLKIDKDYYNNNTKYSPFISFILPAAGTNAYNSPEYIAANIKGVKTFLFSIKNMKKEFREKKRFLLTQLYIYYELILKSHIRILSFIKKNRTSFNYYFLAWIYKLNHNENIQRVFPLV